MNSKFLTLFILALCGLLFAGCADDSRFIVRGQIEGNPTMNLRYTYNSPGGYRSGITGVRDGKFEISGVSARATVLEMFENDYSPLGAVCVRNGQEIDCRIVRGNPLSISANGSDANSRLSKFLSENSDKLRDGESAVKAIGEYVGKNPDDIVSTLLLVTAFDARHFPKEADSLLNLISPEARPPLIAGSFSYLVGRALSESQTHILDSLSFVVRPDSVAVLRPSDNRASLLFFSDAERQRTDTVTDVLSRMADRKGIEVADIYLSIDTMTWARMIRGEERKEIKANWTRGWLPGNVGAPALQAMGIVRLPYVVACDSAGTPLYHGPDILEAERILKEFTSE